MNKIGFCESEVYLLRERRKVIIFVLLCEVREVFIFEMEPDECLEWTRRRGTRSRLEAWTDMTTIREYDKKKPIFQNSR